MIKAPQTGSQLELDLRILANSPQGEALINHLRVNRSTIMELMTQVNDDVRLRQFQGAAVVLGDLIASLTRTPN